jgi:type I restriction enzyme S subunit
VTWTTAALGDVCDIVSGAPPRTSEKRFWGGNILWTTPKDLSDLDGAYLDRPSRTITEEGLKSCATSLLPENSILLSSRAPIGLVAINTVPMATNQGFKSLVPDRRRVDSKFLFHWLKSRTSFLQGLGNGATFKEISKAVVERIEIPLPPLEEQRHIATILDKADALRRKRKCAFTLLGKLTDTLIVQLLDAPRNIQLGEIILDGPTNGLYKPSKDYGEGVPILRINNFYDGEIVDVLSLRRLSVTNSELSRFKLTNDDIVINRVNSLEYLGKSAIVRGLLEPTVYESNMTRFSLNKSIMLPEVCIALLQTPDTKRQILAKAKNAVNQSSINQRDVCSLRLALPAMEIQQKFVARAQRVAALAAIVIASEVSLNTLFSSLQSRAFSGQL